MNKMRPVHPGEVLREEFLAPLELSAHALAQALRVPAPRVNDIVRGRHSPGFRTGALVRSTAANSTGPS